jgi:hypothetical protein
MAAQTAGARGLALLAVVFGLIYNTAAVMGMTITADEAMLMARGKARAGPHDLKLVVRPGVDKGRAQVNFRVGEKEEDIFSLVHTDAEFSNLELRNVSKPVLTIKGSSMASPGGGGEATTAFLDEGEEGRNARVHSARQESIKRFLRSMGGDALQMQAGQRKLLSTESKGEPLAESIKAHGDLNVRGNIMSTPMGDVTVNGVKQWKMISHEDFHKGSVEGWMRISDKGESSADSDVSTCAKHRHENSDYFLGAFGAVKVRKVFDLPPHTFVRIQARVHFLDKWEGEFVHMSVGEDKKWTKSHEWCSQIFESSCQPGNGKTIDVCQDSNFPDLLSVPVDVSFRHVDESGATPEKMQLFFGGDFSRDTTCTSDDDCDGAKCDKGQCINAEATWGLDDVRVYVM